MGSFRFIQRQKMSKPKKICLTIILILLTIIIFGTYWYYFYAYPVIKELGVSNIEALVVKKISQVVQEEMAENEMKYSDIVTINTNQNGEIISLETNIARANYLQAVLAKRCFDVIDITDIKVDLYLGSLFDNIIFTHFGPRYEFRVLANTSMYPRLENNFTAAGINQTRHQIMFTMTVPISVPSRFNITESTVDISIMIAETIIVGKVPNVYAVVDGNDNTLGNILDNK